MVENYADLRDTIINDSDGAAQNACSDFDAGVLVALEWLDEHPDQVLGRTITRSTMHELISEHFYTPVREIDVEAYTEALGRLVVPDPEPEPTNAEKLKAVLDAIGDSTDGYREHLASRLDDAGVKAPGDDDD